MEAALNFENEIKYYETDVISLCLICGSEAEVGVNHFCDCGNDSYHICDVIKRGSNVDMTLPPLPTKTEGEVFLA